MTDGFFCDKCGYVTYNKQSYKRHMARKKPCDKIKSKPVVKPSENTSNGIENTSNDENNLQSRTCDHCYKIFKTPQSLASHKYLKTCSIEPKNPKKCSKCLKIFKTSNSRCVHEKRNTCKSHVVSLFDYDDFPDPGPPQPDNNSNDYDDDFPNVVPTSEPKVIPTRPDNYYDDYDGFPDPGPPQPPQPKCNLSSREYTEEELNRIPIKINVRCNTTVDPSTNTTTNNFDIDIAIYHDEIFRNNKQYINDVNAALTRNIINNKDAIIAAAEETLRQEKLLKESSN